MGACVCARLFALPKCKRNCDWIRSVWHIMGLCGIQIKWTIVILVDLKSNANQPIRFMIVSDCNGILYENWPNCFDFFWEIWNARFVPPNCEWANEWLWGLCYEDILLEIFKFFWNNQKRFVANRFAEWIIRLNNAWMLRCEFGRLTMTYHIIETDVMRQPNQQQHQQQ